jgi:hypothetical protein
MGSEVRQFRMGAHNSLSGLQFSGASVTERGWGSKSLSGGNLNSVANSGQDLGVGEHTSPLALKADTYGSANAAMAWRKHNVLPYGKRTAGSTFSFAE